MKFWSVIGLLFTATIIATIPISPQVTSRGVELSVDQAQASVRNTQTHPAIFAFNEETAVLQVRQETTLVAVVRVGNGVAAHRPFPGYLAYARHKSTPNTLEF